MSTSAAMAAAAAEPVFSTDMKTLLSQLKELDLGGTLGRTTATLSMEEILANMSRTKELARQEKEAKRPIKKYEPPGGWTQQGGLRGESKTAKLEKAAALKNSKCRTIAAFKTPEPKWDGSFTLDPDLQQSIYRTPCRDPSGKKYWNLGREPYRGDRKWIPSSFDTPLPPITVDMLTESFRDRLVAHISRVVEKERYHYEHMEVVTDAQRNLKARHGADLNNLELVKAHLLDEIMEINRKEAIKAAKTKAAKAAAEAQPEASGAVAGSHSSRK